MISKFKIQSFSKNIQNCIIWCKKMIVIWWWKPFANTTSERKVIVKKPVVKNHFFALSLSLLFWRTLSLPLSLGWSRMEGRDAWCRCKGAWGKGDRAPEMGGAGCWLELPGKHAIHICATFSCNIGSSWVTTLKYMELQQISKKKIYKLQLR